ncbi:MAG TPA: hypothetical protein VFV00_10540, partial [Acidimicrobiales bacterium]|nr:hypothetical protein [Acidimicrobiales bacterium]
MRHRIVLLAATAALLAMTAACGARLNSQQYIEARGAGNGAGGGPSATGTRGNATPGAGSTPTTAAGGTADQATPAAGGGGAATPDQAAAQGGGGG